jgi:hypothetical protein
MHTSPRQRRVRSLVFGAVLILGVIASAVLAFIDEPPKVLRLIAVALVAIGAFAPVARQMQSELTPAPWEQYVSFGRREPMFPERDVPWSVFGLVPANTIFKARDVLGGPEDEILKSHSEPEGSDSRVWRRPGFTVSATVYQDELISITVSTRWTHGPRVKIAVPQLSLSGPKIVLGSTRLSDVDLGVAAPTESFLYSAEDDEWIEMRRTTGPEGTLQKSYAVWRTMSKGQPLRDIPFSSYTIESGRIRHPEGHRSWKGWPQL